MHPIKTAHTAPNPASTQYIFLKIGGIDMPTILTFFVPPLLALIFLFLLLFLQSYHNFVGGLQVTSPILALPLKVPNLSWNRVSYNGNSNQRFTKPQLDLDP